MIEEQQRFIAGIRATIERFAMLAPGDRVLIGVSGGPDSLSLLYALHALRDPLSLDLHVAHLNHRLRRAAAADARFVAETAARLDIPCTVEAIDVRAVKQRTGLSLEHAARQERYRFFARVAASIGASVVATAHTADDNVETVLLHLLRGAGTDGLAGIPPVRPLAAPESAAPVRVVRPLLDTWRAAVERYCASLGLEPRLDITNRRRVHLRNRIRLDLLPYLTRHFGPAVKPNLQRLTEIARPETALLEQMAQEALDRHAIPAPGGLSLLAAPLAQLDPALQRRAVRAALRRVKGGPEEIGYHEIERVASALACPEEIQFDLPGPIRVRRQGESLLIFQPEPPASAGFVPLELPVPGMASTPDGDSLTTEILSRPADFVISRQPRARQVYLDADAVFQPLTVRPWEEGDRFVPLGMQGHKSLHKLFIDAGIPAAARRRIPIVQDARGILWVAGVAIADRAKITPRTRRLLRLQWARAEEEKTARAIPGARQERR